jgi:hypothetical protein
MVRPNAFAVFILMATPPSRMCSRKGFDVHEYLGIPATYLA